MVSWDEEWKQQVDACGYISNYSVFASRCLLLILLKSKYWDAATERSGSTAYRRYYGRKRRALGRDAEYQRKYRETHREYWREYHRNQRKYGVTNA